MQTPLRSQLLRCAFPLIRTYGFTREPLALSVLSLPKAHEHPLSDTAVSALFGEGDDARRTLITAWLDNAREELGSKFVNEGASPPKNIPAINRVLKARLEVNEPVLRHLPEAFALLASPQYGLPPLDPTPGMKHAFRVADEACRIVGDTTVGTAWYMRRGSLAAIYSAAELHQLTSPRTAYAFLDTLLDGTTSLYEIKTFANYIGRSWAGIIRSSGII